MTNVADAKDVEDAIEEAKALFQTLKSSEESSSLSTITPKNVVDKIVRPCLNLKQNGVADVDGSPANVF